MKQKIEACAEFASTIENDPIELLKAIKVHTQHYQEHRYNMSIVLESIRGLINTKQKEGELLCCLCSPFAEISSVSSFKETFYSVSSPVLE
jgi:hypothetical protein